jgi:uncharacterized membrane protein
MNFIDPDYKKFYSIYKKLPAICSIVHAIIVCVWGIVDIAVFSYKSPDSNVYHYGIMGLKSAFLVIVIWWMIGIISSIIIWFFSTLKVSATITRTDAALEILKNMNNDSSDEETTLETLPKF